MKKILVIFVILSMILTNSALAFGTTSANYHGKNIENEEENHTEEHITYEGKVDSKILTFNSQEEIDRYIELNPPNEKEHLTFVVESGITTRAICSECGNGGLTLYTIQDEYANARPLCPGTMQWHPDCLWTLYKNFEGMRCTYCSYDQRISKGDKVHFADSRLGHSGYVPKNAQPYHCFHEQVSNSWLWSVFSDFEFLY